MYDLRVQINFLLSISSINDPVHLKSPDLHRNQLPDKWLKVNDDGDYLVDWNFSLWLNVELCKEARY